MRRKYGQRRILSFLICIAMLLTQMPSFAITVYAEDGMISVVGGDETGTTTGGEGDDAGGKPIVVGGDETGTTTGGEGDDAGGKPIVVGGDETGTTTGGEGDDTGDKPVVVGDDDLFQLDGITISGGAWMSDRNYFAVRPEVREDDEQTDWLSLVKGTLMSVPISWEGEAVLFYFEQDVTRHRITLASHDDLDEGKLVMAQGDTPIRCDFVKTDLGGGYLFQGYADFEIGEVEESAKDVTISYEGTNTRVLSMFRPVMKPADYIDSTIGEMYIVDKGQDGTLTMEISGLNLPQGEEASFGQRSYWIGILQMLEDGTENPVALYQVKAYDQDSSVPDAGIYAYTMSNTGVEDTQKCWYPIYMGWRPIKFGNEEEATFPTLNPLTGNSGTSGPKLTSPSVGMPTEVISASLSVILSKGSYAELRYQVDEGEWTAWEEIPESLTLTLTEGDFGNHGVKFEFRDTEEHETSIQRSFVYLNGVQAQAPTSAGVRETNNKNVVVKNGVYHLYVNSDYRLYAVGEAGKKMEVVIWKADGSGVFKTLTWDAERKEYSVLASANELNGADKLAFRETKGTYDKYEGKELVFTLAFQNAPNVSQSTQPWMIKDAKYINGRMYYVLAPGTVINYAFSGTMGEGIKGYAELEYEPVDATDENPVKTVKVSMTEKDGSYSGSAVLPSDASKLIKVTYSVVDEFGNSGITKSCDLRQYMVGATLTLTGFGDGYEGVQVFLKQKLSDNSYSYYRWGDVHDGQISFGSVDLGEYKCVVSGESGMIAEEDFVVTAGTMERKLTHLPELYTLTVYASGDENDVSYTWGIFSRKDGESESSNWFDFVEGKKVFSQIPAGAKGELRFSTWYNEIKIPEPEILEFSGNMSRTITVEPYKKRTVKGKIDGNGHALRFASVISVQTYLRNGETVTVYDTAYTDENGMYELNSVYADFAAEITVKRAMFQSLTANVTAGEGEETRNFTLNLQDELMILPRVKVKPLVMTDANGNALKDEEGNDIIFAGSDVVTQADSSMLAPSVIRLETSGEDGIYVDYDQEILGVSESRYYLLDSDLKTGDKLKVYFAQLPAETGYHLVENVGAEGGSYYKSFAEGKLNEKRNLELEVNALRLGELQATVVDAESDLTGFMLVYKDWGRNLQLVGQAVGKGELTVANLSAGDYAVVTMTADSSLLSAVSSFVADSPSGIYRASSEDNKQIKVTKVTADWGQCRVLGNLTPEQRVDVSTIGAYDFNYKVIPQNDGSLSISVTAIPREENLQMSYVSLIRNGARTDDPLLNGQSMYGSDRSWYLYNDGSADGIFNLSFQDDPTDASKAEANINIAYYLNGSYKSQTLNIHQNVNLFHLIVPEKQIVGLKDDPEADWSVPVVIRNTPKAGGEVVTVYDNGKAVGTFTVKELDTKVKIKLADKREGSHVIHAVKGSGAEYRTTVKSYLSVRDGSKEIYLSHFYWLHRNDTRVNQWFFENLDDMAGQTFRYYPSKGSTIVFRLNNVTPSEIENVKFITYYRGVPTYWNARKLLGYDTGLMSELYKDMGGKFVSYESPTWSTWIVDTTANPEAYGNKYGPSLGSFNSFGISYDLKTESFLDEIPMDTLSMEEWELLLADESEEGTAALLAAINDPGLAAYNQAMEKAEASAYNVACAAETMNYNDAETIAAMKAGKVDFDEDAIPDVLRDIRSDLQDDKNITETDTTYKVKVENEDANSGLKGFSMEYELEKSTVDSLNQKMYREKTGKENGEAEYQNISWISFESEQGPVYVRREVLEEKSDASDTTGTAVVSKIQMEYFVPTSALDAVLDAEEMEIVNSVGEENATPTRSATRKLAKAKASIMDQSMTGMKGLNECYGYYDMAEGIYRAKNGIKNGFFSDNVDNGMTLINTVTTAYDIMQGPKGRSPEGLWEALSMLKGTTAHSQRALRSLTSDIRDYSQLRDDMYLWDSAQASVQAGSGWANLNVPQKVAFFLGGKAYDFINDGWSYPALNAQYDTIMRSIMYEIRMEAIHEQKDAEKRLKELEEKLRARLIKEGIKEWDLERKLKEVLRQVTKNKIELRMKLKIPDFNLYIDPSGYVFEAVEEDRVAGITATLYQGNGTTVDNTTSYKVWVDQGSLGELPQDNPVITADIGDTVTDADGNIISGADVKGRYGWMTPEGVWKVRFTDPTGKYQTTETKPMEVPPAHTAVNIGLLSTAVPALAIQEETTGDGAPAYSEDKKLSAYANKLIFQFDSWMQLESLIDVTQAGAIKEDGSYDVDYAAFVIKDADGNAIPGSVSFPDKKANTGYKSSLVVDKYDENGNKDGTVVRNNPYQTDYIDSDWFVKTVVFTPDAEFAQGQKITVTISKNVLSYAGMSMAADFTGTVTIPSTVIEKLYSVTFVAGNGTADLVKNTDAAGMILFPGNPERDGFSFVGWFTEPSGGKQVTQDTQFKQDTMLYARWQKVGGIATISNLPTARMGLKYNGKNQELVKAGSGVANGTLQYALGTAAEATQSYGTAIPTGAAPGKYYVYYKVAGDLNYEDSAVGCIEVSIEKADGPEAPKGLSGVAPSEEGLADGKITGVTTAMEWSAKNDFTDAKACNGTEVTDLAAGTYYVRISATETTKAGAITIVKVEEGAQPLPTVKFGDVNKDDKVNRADRIYLARALANWDGYVMPSADVADFTGDGKVNRADRIYLARALANWSDYSLGDIAD